MIWEENASICVFSSPQQEAKNEPAAPQRVRTEGEQEEPASSFILVVPEGFE